MPIAAFSGSTHPFLYKAKRCLAFCLRKSALSSLFANAMTLEIQEISIKINIIGNTEKIQIADLSNSVKSLPLSTEQSDLIVQRCVREVMNRLRLRERR